MPALLEELTTFSIKPAPPRPGISIVAVATLVLWSGCLLVGTLGFVLPYARPEAPRKELPSVKMEVVQVELTNDPLPPAVPAKGISLPQPPVLEPIPVTIPEVSPLVAVAEPTSVAFALPVEGPVVLVETARASFAAPTEEPKPTVAAPPVQVLNYGQGEGRQPAPDYPLRARREGQEGVVTVQFSVGEDGRVLSAEAVARSPWKLLNDSALRVVRERWRFSTGPARLFQVSIRFQLTR